MDFTPTLPMASMGNNGFGQDGMGLMFGLILGSALNGGGLFGGNRNGADIATTQLSQQIQDVNAAVNNNSINSELGEIQNAIQSSTLASLMGIKDNSNLYLQQGGAISTAIANSDFQTLNSINGAVGTITTQNYNAALQSLNSFNGLGTTILQGFNEIGRDSANATNQIQATLQQQTMQQAACCCEIQKTITAGNQRIIDTITANRILDLTEQVNDLKTQNSNILQTNALNAAMAQQTNIILNHLKPYPIVA